MLQNRLRIYYGPEETAGPATIPMREEVKLPLGEVLPLLVEAAKGRRAWIDDVSDDEIAISSELDEVLLAYQHVHRPSA
jgi:hypothetical protein